MFISKVLRSLVCEGVTALLLANTDTFIIVKI
jgi:hypothetical protein